MRKRRRSKVASQLLPEKLGVSKWQRDFWIALIQHAQSEKRGPPDLSQLAGFKNPAVSRYSVTTTDLWHGFDKYNAGKPYHRQVRPFGFMVMFQQKESADTGDNIRQDKRSPKKAPTMLRVIAPFNRNPAAAARHAFDRDTGVVILARQLKSYASALRHYHNHPEAKFLNGERADRGPTTRRHIIARSIRHIGKEANRLDEQQSMGIDPTAQSGFGSVSENRSKRLNGIRVAADTFGPSRVAREAKISSRYLFQILNTETTATELLLSKLDQAIATIEIAGAEQRAGTCTALAWLRTECERISLRQVAKNLGVDTGHLSRMMAGKRPLSIALVRAINATLRQLSD